MGILSDFKKNVKVSQAQIPDERNFEIDYMSERRQEVEASKQKFPEAVANYEKILAAYIDDIEIIHSRAVRARDEFLAQVKGVGIDIDGKTLERLMMLRLDNEQERIDDAYEELRSVKQDYDLAVSDLKE